MAMNPAVHSFRSLKRLARMAVGRDLWQARQLRTETLTLGAEDASWTVCPSHLSPTSTVYCLGVGEEISFDLALIARFGVTVHAFDPTPRTLQWINAQTLPPRFVFHPWGVAAHDGTGRFSPPHNPGHISHSLIERDTPWPAIEVPVRRLATLLGLLGHESIDLLKMDIEGAEYEVIDDLLSSGVAVDQLLIEFHHRWPEVGIDKTRKAIRQLHDAGYRIFTSSASGEEYGFLKNEWNHQPPNP